MVSTCDSHSRDTKTGGSDVQGHPQIYNKLQESSLAPLKRQKAWLMIMLYSYSIRYFHLNDKCLRKQFKEIHSWSVGCSVLGLRGGRAAWWEGVAEQSCSARGSWEAGRARRSAQGPLVTSFLQLGLPPSLHFPTMPSNWKRVLSKKEGGVGDGGWCL